VTTLAIRSNDGTLVGMECPSCGEGFACTRRHHQRLHNLPPADSGTSPSGSTCRLSLSQLDLAASEAWLGDPRPVQANWARGLEAPIRDERFMAQVGLPSRFREDTRTAAGRTTECRSWPRGRH
jgi:hypothetical protein